MVIETDIYPINVPLKHLTTQEFNEAVELECSRGAFDIIFYFLPKSQVDAEQLVAFFWHLWMRDNQFFYIIMQRLAYSTGEEWIREFRTIFLERGPQHRQVPDPEWSSLEASGRLYDQSRRLASTISSIPSALQLACSARNMQFPLIFCHSHFRLIM